jgi:hypothetical protein
LAFASLANLSSIPDSVSLPFPKLPRTAASPTTVSAVSELKNVEIMDTNPFFSLPNFEELVSAFPDDGANLDTFTWPPFLDVF